jgi:hypothetical protein
MSEVLVDASFLIAMGYPKDKNHDDAVKFATLTEFDFLIPSVVLPEVMYNLRRVGGSHAALEFGSALLSELTSFIRLTLQDYERALAIMRTYQNVELDFVDSCLTAIAERLEVTQICTFDRRDFSIIRPAHTDYFEMLP